MRVLVAEDETIIRLDLRDLLERLGLEVCAEARDGEEAVRLARTEKPDVAILDVKMPKLDGIRTATARHEELAALREEAESLAEALAARKAIERAKGLLMEKEGLSEQEAFERLRRASQISGRPLRVVAEALIATFVD